MPRSMDVDVSQIGWMSDTEAFLTQGTPLMLNFMKIQFSENGDGMLEGILQRILKGSISWLLRKTKVSSAEYFVQK